MFVVVITGGAPGSYGQMPRMPLSVLQCEGQAATSSSTAQHACSAQAGGAVALDRTGPGCDFPLVHGTLEVTHPPGASISSPVRWRR